ncbi:serine hydrolase domain-containing protein [Maritalea sp.]|uniref:serine hydrolase domain-containing protein n=1 Tax=Maritalea sp. TaxID=2003361 RepID=UPI003EF1972F
MKWVSILAKTLFGLLAMLVLGISLYLFLAPPELLRVATNYSAKIVCSNVFVAGRDAIDVQNVDVQAGGHPILGYINVDVDEPQAVVTAKFLGLFATGKAVYREGLGCASLPTGSIEDVKNIALPSAEIDGYFEQSEWPMGDHNIKIDGVLADEELVGPNMRAVVVIKDGRLISETYGTGFDANVPLLGWSMAKTVTGLIIGTLPPEKRTPDRDQLLSQWQIDDRKSIQLQELMSMSSGLSWNEGYGSVSDVTRMLYLEPDMAKFASSLPLEDNWDAHLFEYSSGTTVLLSRIWQNAVDAKSLIWPHKELFGPLGMKSATLETDAAGTYIGSSYLYATARDWARIGQLILQNGRWANMQIVPSDYVRWMTTGANASKADWGVEEYGQGQIWLHGPRGDVPNGTDPDAEFEFPRDIRWMLGHDGQSVAIVPSKRLVVVRMGLTPSDLGYRPQKLVAAIIDALKE